MAGQPVGQLCAFIGLKLRHNVFIEVIGFEIVEETRCANVEAAMVRLAGPVGVALARGFSRHGIVFIEEADEIADVEVGAPFLFRNGIRAAHEDRDDDLRFVFKGHGAVADHDLRNIVVAVMIESIIDRILEAEHGQELEAVHLRSGAARIGLRGIVNEIRVAVILNVICERAADYGDRRKFRMIDRVVAEEIAEIHREADGRRAVVAALHLSGEGIAVRLGVVFIGDAVEIRVNWPGSFRPVLRQVRPAFGKNAGECACRKDEREQQSDCFFK